MSFQQLGGSAANNDYDYQSGSGMDNFLSRAIDEVSWQTNLGTFYNSLSELPIGTYPTQSTPTNYDLSAQSGSQNGSSTLGGTGTGNAANGGSLSISPNQQQITISDGTNQRLLIGQQQGGF